MTDSTSDNATLIHELGRGPKGTQVREILQNYIATLPPGSALPSERELAERFSVARTTVREQIDRMASQGLLYKQRRRGTFVAEPPRLSHTERLTTFTEDMHARGLAPGSRLLGVDTIRAGRVHATRMEVGPDSRLIRVRRVRTADGVPMALEETYLPAGRFRALQEADFASGSLYELLARRYDVAIGDASVRITVLTLDAGQAALLETEAGAPAFLLERTARDTEGSVVEFASSIYRGDRYEVLMHPQRPQDVITA